MTTKKDDVLRQWIWNRRKIWKLKLKLIVLFELRSDGKGKNPREDVLLEVNTSVERLAQTQI